MRTVRVSGPGVTPYEVRIGRGLLAAPGPWVAPLLRRLRATVVTDETVGALHGPRLAEGLARAGIEARLLAVPAGERSKSMGELARLLDRLSEAGLDRQDVVIALGGGVVGDLAGLAAALYMRGVDLIQAPTTLLAQVDSSVGGKTAVDTRHGKNLVGAFHHPRLVLADLDALDTLPERQLRAGHAEVLKSALLADAGFFAWLEAHQGAVLARQAEPLAHAIDRAVEIKAAIVAEDPREGGRRALLNLGHTFAHALEAEAGYGEGLAHGEAVAVGCVLAFRLSERLGLCEGGAAGRVRRAVAAAGLPTRIDEVGRFDPERLLARMAGDKKAEGGSLTFVLARRVGEAVVVRDVDPAEVRAVLEAGG